MRTLTGVLSCLCLCLTARHTTAQAPVPKIPSVFAAYATPLEEPWNMVIHDALLAAQRGGRITYSWQDDLSSDAAMADGIRGALAKKPDVVVADGIVGAAGIRAAAAANPAIAFVVGSSAAPAPPNLSVFDSNLSEPAYLCGIVAGKLTKSNVVGVVAGQSDVQVHRALNAYIQGAREANPAVKVKVTFIDSWYDPPRARQAAMDQAAAGADLIWAEREGAIAGARDKGVLAFGNLVDQHAEAPETVVTGPVWSMTPLVDHVVKQASAGMVRGESLLDFSAVSRGGSILAPWHGWDEKLPPGLLELVREKQVAMKTGALRIAPGADKPAGD